MYASSRRRRRARARAGSAPPRAADGSPADRTGVLLAGASWLKSLVAALHWARWALERRVVRAEDLAPRPGEEDDPAHPLAAAAAFLREGGAPALDELPLRDDEDAARKQSSGASSRAVREWRRARVKASVQILVLAQHVASDAKTIEGAASFLGALERGGDGAGLARLACAAVPRARDARRGHRGRADGRRQPARGRRGAPLAARDGGPGRRRFRRGDERRTRGGASRRPGGARVRAAARDGARAALRRGGRFDLGAADLRSARGLGAARRLAAGYRALANVNLLRALLPAEGPASRSRLARRLLLAAFELGPDASPAQTAAGKALVTVGVHLGVPPDFISAVVLGDEVGEDDGEGAPLREGVDPSSQSASSFPGDFSVANLPRAEIVPRSAKAAARAEAAGEAFLQRFSKDVVAACRWSFAKFAPELVRRVVEGGRGSAAATRLLSAALDPPPNASGSFAASFKEREILDAFARHAPSLASLVREGGGPGDLATARDAGARRRRPGRRF